MNGWLLLTGAILLIPEKDAIAFTFTSGTKLELKQGFFGAVFILAGLVLP